MAFKLVHEYEPDKFRLFTGGRLMRTFAKANRITEYADGRREHVEIDVPPYEAEINISEGSARQLNAEELAACKLHKVLPFEPPKDKAVAGAPTFLRDKDGVVVETIPLKDLPPPPTTDQKIEQVLQHVGMTREELRAALAAGALRA